MNIDFHTHGKLAKKLPVSSSYIQWLFQEAKTVGLDAICLTEHFNTLNFAEFYQYIEDTYELDGDSYLTKGVRIFAGMETDIAEGGHILTLGKLQDILELNRRLEPFKEKDHFLEFEKLLKLLREYPVIIGAAHPYREGSNIPTLPNELLEQFDFLDLNGKDLAVDYMKTQKQVYALGKALNKPVVSGSDTHQAFQYGCIRNNFYKECSTLEELAREMRAQRYQIITSDQLSFQVKTANVLKKALKEIHALGGDYVSVLTKDAV
jgi:histidinol phosphatase-like PHP family hydrolase